MEGMISESMETLERKKKKEEKAREKELKKLKAAQKARLQVNEASNDGSKKRERKKVVRKDGGKEEDYLNPETPDGEKKQLSLLMPKEYDPKAVERSWYSWWEKSGFFSADSNSSKPPFVIVLPPPNVTGPLHIGHALTSAIEDTIIRWRRMSGYNTLWIPGMDHGGMGTQVVVERKIDRERNLTRHDLGREKFVAEVLDWKDKYGGRILKQQRRLGASLDWSRECFTMDEKRSRAVTEAFVRLYNEGLIYRDVRLVMWDCTLRTAISKLEVDKENVAGRLSMKVPGYEEQIEFGVITSFAYPLEQNLGEIVVSTTRLETMLGDTAIAVHPDDARYKHLHDKVAIHPFNGRKIPIICDEIADPEFGTGAVKITPAHDFDDFLVGKRHNLDFISVFTDDGKIDGKVGQEFAGMPRFKARSAILKALQQKGLYRGTKDNEMSLSICSKSRDIVEPIIKPQWYIKCNSMAKDALDAVLDDEKRKIEIIPKHYMADWKRWFEDINDWCISRQIWWGHKIPAWYVTLEDDDIKEVGAYNDHWIVCRCEEEAQAEASKRFVGKKFIMTRDPDVLDTWFSSGLFPLSVLGWPDVTDELKAFYPTSVLETGHDILFFWVARMVMLGMKLGGDVPFKKVYLHPMIRDAHGRKMSKSLGNVVDPLDVINGISLEGLHNQLEEGNLDASEHSVAKEGQKKDFPKGIPECGTDALRFALVSYTAQSDKINLDIQRVAAYRQWCNKLWNATRFALDKLGDNYLPPTSLNCGIMPLSCQWILSVLNKAVEKTVSSLEAYEFSDAASAVYYWWQSQLCDVFIELIKPYFSSNEFTSARDFARDTLWVCLDTGFRLLHPFMPFVTEELWQRLPRLKDGATKESIVISEYPSVNLSWTNDRVEREMQLVEGIVKSLRSLKSSLPPKERHERGQAFALCRDGEVAEVLDRHMLEILTLASLSSLKIMVNDGPPPPLSSFALVTEKLLVYIERETIQIEQDCEKMRKKMEETSRQIEALQKMMNSSSYIEKIPARVHEENVAKLTKLKLSIEGSKFSH